MDTTRSAFQRNESAVAAADELRASADWICRPMSGTSRSGETHGART